jgi:hypothetical protein
VVNSVDGVTVNSGGNIKVNDGGDIKLRGSDTNPGSLIFATPTLNRVRIGLNSGTSMFMGPVTDAVPSLFMGTFENATPWGPPGSSEMMRFYQIKGAASRILQWSCYYSPTRNGYVTLDSTSTRGLADLGAGPYYWRARSGNVPGLYANGVLKDGGHNISRFSYGSYTGTGESLVQPIPFDGTWTPRFVFLTYPDAWSHTARAYIAFWMYGMGNYSWWNGSIRTDLISSVTINGFHVGSFLNINGRLYRFVVMG